MYLQNKKKGGRGEAQINNKIKTNNKIQKNTTPKNKRKTYTTRMKANNSARDKQAGKNQSHTKAGTQANAQAHLQRVCVKKKTMNNKPIRPKNPVNKAHTNKTRVCCVAKDDNGNVMIKLINTPGV